MAVTEQGPVFVAGLERTGTSLMFALLASHPRIAMTRRTNLWTYFYGQYGDLADPENFERCLGTMMKYKRLVVLEPDEDRLRSEFRKGEPSYGRLFALLEQQHADRLGKPRWGDKSLNTERYAAPIFEAYPNARILHMIRDPRDRFASVLARWKTRRGGVGAGTGMWISSAHLAQRNEKRYPGKYRAVRYESLVAEPEESAREICEFIGEEYAPEMLSMSGAEKFREQGSNSSYGAREVGAIATDSIGRHRDVLAPQQIAFIQTLARREMREFGYEQSPVSLTPTERIKFYLADVPLDSARMLAWKSREGFRDRKGRDLPEYRIVKDAS